MTENMNIVYLDVALLKTLTAKVTDLQAQVAALRRELAAVRQSAANDVLYRIAEAFQRLPERVEEMVRRREASGTHDHPRP
jgi:hypothetical protein